MDKHQLFEKAYLTLIQEKKDHIINKIDSLDPEEKKEMIEFFTVHPNLENKIDWNKPETVYDKFKELKNKTVENSRSYKKKAISEKLSNAFKPVSDQVRVWYEDKNIIFVSPKTYTASKFMRTVYNQTAHWCISTDESSYWFDYVYERCSCFCMVYIAPLNKKWMIEITTSEGANLWNQFDDDILQDAPIEGIIDDFNEDMDILQMASPSTQIEGDFFEYLYDFNYTGWSPETLYHEVIQEAEYWKYAEYKNMVKLGHLELPLEESLLREFLSTRLS